jgi:hypothetical protein
MKVLIMQLSRASCYFKILGVKYSLQHPSNAFNLCTSLNVRHSSFKPVHTTGKIIILYILIFTLGAADREAKGFRLSGS